jgi:nicotinamidase-related amidase
VPGLEPIRGERVVRKRRFSGFYETALASVLHSSGVEAVILAGYSADVCVRFTAVDAYNHGYSLSIVQDCVEAFKEPKSTSITYLQWLTDCTILSISEVHEFIARKKAT